MELNLAQVHEAIAEAMPDKECIVFRDRRFTWAQVTERTRRLANALSDRGLGARSTRDGLAGHESHQDHLALYLYNGNEYLEGMLGAYKARVAPFNVNYRYVEEELQYLLADAGARGIIYHEALAPTLARVLPGLPQLQVLLQVADGSGHALLPGAVDYEEALAAASPERPDLEWSPDDLYILYTGGTTGMPKGVLWRQADIFVGALGGRTPDQREHESIESVVEAARSGAMKLLPSPPFMHGAGHWISFMSFHGGHTVVIQDEVTRLDPHDVLSTIERERVNFLLIVGDAFGRPILDHLGADPSRYDLSSLQIVLSGGAPLNATLKARFLELLPHLMLIDGVGSSEAGGQLQQVTTAGSDATTGTFVGGPDNCIVNDDLTAVLARDDDSVGWLAKTGRIPLGYLGDADKTARTFPVIDGVRYSVPGDRARLRADGMIELLGRDSVTINSGGEKIFAEEVEAALGHHPDVYDAVVVGRPSEKWGNEVVAVVQLRDGAAADEPALLEECARHVARYKLPKHFVFVDHVVRSPAGKADYRWAKGVVAADA
jgi:fatty-acyl-CoA synthase